MATISIQSTDTQNIFNQLSLYFGEYFKVKNNEFVLSFNNKLGNGRFCGRSFKDGITHLEIELTLRKSFSIQNYGQKNPPLYIAYCSRGYISHSFKTEIQKRVLENFRTGIFTNEPNSGNILFFDSDKHVKCSIFIIDKCRQNNSDGTTLITQLQNSLLKNQSPKNYIFISSYNLKLAEKLEQISVMKHRSYIRNLFLKGLVYEVLAIAVQQHEEDIKKHKLAGNLRSSEIDSIRKISEFIKNNPDRQLNITQLCSKTGLSPSKLQYGFKLLYGTTVNDYSRKVRLKYAEQLIKSTDLNISQVVYSIGFTSRSYFSKIFKKKYKCSPKQYKVQQSTVPIPV
ncbi:AraC family transcriptional regulator [Arenibacter palladensis]|uniref:AraC family transcriptional regulator n=1 Tax=Arenibacter palladensis TaxID=237373 RepID=UPI002FD75D8E